MGWPQTVHVPPVIHTVASCAQEVAVIAGRLELLLLLYIVVHGKVVTHCGVATNSTHMSPVLHAYYKGVGQFYHI